ncbi:hypothetical protein Pmani_015250 [Petrolisthes manimaculis]|uniref:Uncharacterized protein n=1 Tax=Petrolisthes manimaculis TaxID=1843537 RepID=A0AAE1UA35_9EUCA|nr:hypothetical protein Pmani_015250 [Petrolisthes manimaculis]
MLVTAVVVVVVMEECVLALGRQRCEETDGRRREKDERWGKRWGKSKAGGRRGERGERCEEDEREERRREKDERCEESEGGGVRGGMVGDSMVRKNKVGEKVW